MFFLPDTVVMITIIALIIKNKSGDLSDNNNYRPIVLANYLHHDYYPGVPHFSLHVPFNLDLKKGAL